MKPALTVKQVAELLSVNERTVYRLAQAGKMPAFKVSGTWRFLAEDIRRWIEEQKRAAAFSAGDDEQESAG